MQTKPPLTTQKIYEELYSVLLPTGNHLLRMRKEGLTVNTKTNFRDIVTQADQYSERRIAAFLNHLFPHDSIRGEEGHAQKGVSGIEWILDPIDGTIPYVRGLDYFSISVGRIVNGVADLGALYFPAKGLFVFAAAGMGVTINGLGHTPWSSLDELKDAFMGFDFSAGDDREMEIDRYLKPLTLHCRYPKTFAAMTGGVLECIMGQLDGFVCAGASVYDIGASLLIAKEAGCCLALFDNTLKEFVPFSDPDFMNERFPLIIARSPKVLEKLCTLFNT